MDKLEWNFLEVIEKFDGKHIGTTEGIWMPGGESEPSCICFLCGTKVHKVVCENIIKK